MLLFHRNVVFQFAFKKGTQIDDLISVYSDNYSSQANYLAIYGKKGKQHKKTGVFYLWERSGDYNTKFQIFCQSSNFFLWHHFGFKITIFFILSYF